MDDGWAVGQESMTPLASGGGRFEIELAPEAPLLVAVIAEPATDFRVKISFR